MYNEKQKKSAYLTRTSARGRRLSPRRKTLPFIEYRALPRPVRETDTTLNLCTTAKRCHTLMDPLIFQSWKIDIVGPPYSSHLAESRDILFCAVMIVICHRCWRYTFAWNTRDRISVSARLFDCRLYEHCEMRDSSRRRWEPSLWELPGEN